jgi:cytochrome c556
MRTVPFALASFLMVGACGGPQTSQANNGQANISNDSRSASAANSSAVVPTNAMVMLTIPSVSGPQAAAIMHERHEGMESMGNDLKTLHRALDSDDPNMAAIRSAAADIAKKSKAASGWFPAGTGPEAGKTGAKPDIWQNPQDFAAKLAAFQKVAQQFYATALAGDANGLKANADDLAGTCKACHDKYRMEMKH